MLAHSSNKTSNDNAMLSSHVEYDEGYLHRCYTKQHALIPLIVKLHLSAVSFGQLFNVFILTQVLSIDGKYIWL
ncbi:hypothetical protein JTE90_008327 [Oedothorax gibbosus]|uniref:Uncharacterized protein n=1 Tax=Oedothorax gibbosus TaxID=931172 RepID=A0AAV6TXZ3_9ARAC|nr:hypothetical protein JTE90_008327 [Oedothorax gibbosus]